MGPEGRSVQVEDAAMVEADQALARRGCCFFWVPWSSSSAARSSGGGSGGSFWERISVEHRAEGGQPWWTRGWYTLMKLREWSELVAGPRWKTFIRRIGRGGAFVRRGGGGGQFQYDPLSYALNFDEGSGGRAAGSSDGDVVYYRDFSARYAALPASVKSSMVSGARDLPPLFVSTPVSAH